MAMALPTFQEEPACAKMCPNLTYKQRLIGFGACFVFGYLLSFIGTMTLIGGFSEENVRVFIALYIVGNVIALCATGFLLGPKRQCMQMWHPTRRYTTAFFLSMLIIVFAVAVAKQHVAIVITLLIIEILAAIWYSASFIPFGRKMIHAFLRRTCCGPCYEAYDKMPKAPTLGNGVASEGTAKSLNPFGGQKKSMFSSLNIGKGEEAKGGHLGAEDPDI